VKELRGKVAVVTGAASGIGRGLAERFATEGMKIVLADVEEPALEAAVGDLVEGGAQAIGVPTDVSRTEDVEALADQAVAAFGTAHVVCNNAGVTAGGLFADIPPEIWDWVLGVNFRGVLHGCKVFLPLLQEQGEGHIVNTSSIAAFKSSFFTGSPYVTSKFAVLGLSENLHHELAMTGSPVGVSVLCPSFVSTRILQSDRNRPAGITISEDPRRTRALQMARIGMAAGLTPSEVADHVVGAIRESRFFVLPHPDEACEAVEDRLRWMRTNEPPGSAGAAPPTSTRRRARRA
jgi:NAD(P)-dependent dehydrogenase (short-subunit alcohol dehydrogenase family)